MIDWDDVLSAAAVIRDAAAEVDHSLGKGSPEGVTLSELARLTLLVDEADKVLDHVREYTGKLLSEMMEQNEATVPGVAYLVRNWTKNRSKWDNDALVRDVLRQLQAELPPHAVEPDTGERVHTWEQAVTALLRTFSIGGYQARITQLQRLGLDPSEYCIEKPWSPKVTVTAIEPEQNDE